MNRAQEWLAERGIRVRKAFGIEADKQPLILHNKPHLHAAIYFLDPDGNSLELICPLRLDEPDEVPCRTLSEWNQFR